MGTLFDKVRTAVEQDRFLVSDHADERMRERGMMAWQLAAGISVAKLLNERPDSQPNPTVEVEQLLADGTNVVVIWAWLELEQVAKLVTAYLPDEP